MVDASQYFCSVSRGQFHIQRSKSGPDPEVSFTSRGPNPVQIQRSVSHPEVQIKRSRSRIVQIQNTVPEGLHPEVSFTSRIVLHPVIDHPDAQMSVPCNYVGRI